MKRSAFVFVAATLLLCLAGAVTAFTLIVLHTHDQDATIGRLAASLDVTRQQVESRGDIPAAPPASEIVKGEAGATGPPGRPPTPEEVASAVTAYLTANPPQPGRPPTAQEIADAVAAFCADGRCMGAAGTNGEAGSNGTNGTNGTNGAPGPGPTDSQVAAAVTAYCDAHNQCAGPPGPPGPGPQSFSFTFLLTTYQCRDADGDGHYDCVAT